MSVTLQSFASVEIIAGQKNYLSHFSAIISILFVIVGLSSRGLDAIARISRQLVSECTVEFVREMDYQDSTIKEKSVVCNKSAKHLQTYRLLSKFNN